MQTLAYAGVQAVRNPCKSQRLFCLYSRSLTVTYMLLRPGEYTRPAVAIFGWNETEGWQRIDDGPCICQVYYRGQHHRYSKFVCTCR